ncbi:MAG TPA: CaiB/BaiF CoA-transferase family protein [Hyphomicrobiaceae bacterium]|nr:CaiB/BaiF CoA-transferase family protein [Hyphomicrobiaceae bacterium]
MGPLEGMRVVEMAGIGPAPFTAMLLADMGAEVIRIDRRTRIDLGTPQHRDPRYEVLRRGRRSVAVDVKAPDGRDVVLRLAAQADALIEGFRPGVMERLGLGPDACLAVNPRLVYGRVTGFGQRGPLAPRAGHDIDYIALAGVLGAIGPPDGPPTPPLNLVGDFGGGGMLLAFGILAARLSALRTGEGQVVDAAMVDGAAYLMAPILGLHSAGLWHDERGANVLDGGAPWYGTYLTADDKYMAVGAIERRFYDELLEKLGLADQALPDQYDRSGWPLLRARFAAVFRTRTQAEWENVFAGSDACVAPVLSLAEAPRHPHNRERGTFIERNGVTEPAPAPRLSRTPGAPGHPPHAAGADSEAVLADWGFSSEEIERLSRAGVIGTA